MDAKACRITRLLDGILIYVETDVPKRTFSFTLNVVSVREQDGRVRPYRGESFSELGLKVGKNVTAIMDGSKPTQLCVRAR